MSEGEVVSACIKWLLANNCFIWRNNSGAFKASHGNFIRFGKKGSGDIIGLTPNGRFIAVECKYADGQMSKEQEEFRKEIIKRGGIYIVARDSAMALEENKALILSEYW